MAIIKCPECGHQVSEKAPACPSCGVQIAGKLTRCTECGEVYFNDQPLCPSCHRPTTDVARQPQYRSQSPAVPVPAAGDSQSGTNNQTADTPKPAGGRLAAGTNTPAAPEGGKKTDKPKSYTSLIISIVFALIVCGVCYYYYNDAKGQKELEDYEYAMQSTDPIVLQSYLDRYRDADEAHRDSVQVRLQQLQKIDEEWANAVVSGTRKAIEDYIKTHPGSPHKADALNKLDSMDFDIARNANSLEAMQKYIEQHPTGRFADLAKNSLESLKQAVLSPEEQQKIKTLFKHFFQSINSKNEGGMLETVSEYMDNFLDKQGAGKSDVSSFLKRIYKADITNMNWHIIDDYSIEKKEESEGSGVYDYTVRFTAEQNIERTDASQPKKVRYRISGTVNSEGKISALNMMRLAE